MDFKLKIGLGTFPFSNIFSEVTQGTAEQIIDVFLRGGGQYIETAPSYPVNKVILGDILNSYPRESLFIATKCVTGTDKDGKKVRSGKFDHLLQQASAEIERLKIDKLDLLQSHIIPDDVSVKELGNNLQMLKDKDLTNAVGVSNVDLYTLKEMLQYCNIEFVQNRFSLIHQNEQRELEGFCIDNKIYFNPFQIIERGLLTEVSKQAKKWREGDLRNSKFEYNNIQYDIIRGWVEKLLIPIARNNNLPLENLILAWTNQQPAVKLSVVGATSVDQISGMIQKYEILSDETLKSITEAYKILQKEVYEKYNLNIDEFRGLK